LRLASPRTAAILGGLALALLAAAIPLSVLAHEFTGNNLFPFLLMIPFGGVGLLVATRQPRNAIGWILLALALVLTVWQDAAFYSIATYRGGRDLPLARLAVVLASGWVAVIVLLPLPILLFPDGRLPTQRWRWPARLYAALAIVLVGAVGSANIGAFTHRRITVDSSGELKSLSGPSGGAALTLTIVAFLVWALLSLFFVGGRLVSYRRSTGEQRQQLKWLMSGGATCIIGFFIADVFSTIHTPISSIVSGAGVAAIAGLPVGLGVGILKYRLYEIDRLISRTLSYAILTGLLVGVFIGVVVLATDVLPFSSPVGVAASTLAAAALFNPLRGRVQRGVDRRFNRARYDAEAIVTAFTMRLRDAVDLDTVRSELLHAVTRAVEPSHASVWIRPPASRR
jgi:hypothetical protein